MLKDTVVNNNFIQKLKYFEKEFTKLIKIIIY